MPPSPTNSSLEFHAGLRDLLWRQWSALGVAGTAKPAGGACIDLEALVLLTTTQGRRDARLFDEVLDWLWNHGQMVNVQRLRNIQRSLALGEPRVIAAIAAWLTQRSTLSKWKSLAVPPAESASSPEPFFSSGDGARQPVFGESDPIFLRHGFRRGPIRRRELSQAPNPTAAALLPWKLRSLFGVQARCEVLLWLLTHLSGNPADIARASFYFPRTVEETLNEMAGSGLVQSARTGREKRFWLKPADWSFLRTWDAPAGFPAWIDWPRLFAVQTRLMAVLDRTDLSPTLQASELRRVFAELQPILMAGSLTPWFRAGRHHTGVDFTAALRADLGALPDRIEAENRR